MSQYCKLTGIDLSKDGATNGFKSMCLNCKSCHLSPLQSSYEEQQYVCDNDAVMQVGMKKVIDSLPEGFEIETLKLKPMKLKDPTKKCKNHVFDLDKVVEFIQDYFTVPEEAEKENASE